MSITSTEEMFRVVFEGGDNMVLMRQSYSDDVPFYYVTESHKGDGFDVDTASQDLQDIIKSIGRRIGGYKNQMSNLPKDEISVRRCYDHVVSVTIEFLEKLKAARAEQGESTGSTSANTTNGKIAQVH